MKLSEYLTTPNTDVNDHIFLNKFENLFKKLNNNDDIFFYVANHHKTPEDLKKYFSFFSNQNKKIKFLVINPDIDIPFLKSDIIQSIETEKYTDDKQNFWDSKSINFFIDNQLNEIIPDNVEIYCFSNIVKNDKINMIPLGRDFKGTPFIEKYDLKNKINLCYLNFSTPPKSLHWYGRIREYIYKNYIQKEWVLIDNVNTNDNRDIYNNFKNYYTNLSQSKFMVAPRGCGLDTYRLWDSIYLGCVPIVVDYENNTGYNDFRDLPILFLSSWEEYFNLTEDYLNKIWDDMLDTEYNYEKLSFSFWENKIKNN